MSPRRLATSTAKSASLASCGHSGSDVQAVLTELFVLLDEYGPHWYTEDHRDRFTRAIAELEKRRGFSLIDGRGSEKQMIREAIEGFNQDIQSGSRG